MSPELQIDRTTLAHTSEVLARQSGHCTAVADYLDTHGSIGSSTGLLLSMFVPLSDGAVALGSAGARLGHRVCDATSSTVASSLSAYDTADTDAVELVRRLAAKLVDGATVPVPALPGIPPLGAPVDGAPVTWGTSDAWVGERMDSAVGSLVDAVSEAVENVQDVGAWSGPAGPVVEASDPRSYLVPPSANENFLQDLRWNAGVVLGSLDWICEKLCGYSILAELVFKPFAGDPRGIERAAGAWGNGSAALSAIALNHARLVPTTVEGWQGIAGDGFRAAMAGLSEGFMRLSELYSSVSTATGLFKFVVVGACAGIGLALRTLAELCIEAAAELAVPGVGWGVFLATCYWKVEKIFMLVRLIHNLIDGAFAAIAAFVEAQALAVENLGRFEDLAEGVLRRTQAMV